jgi:hypothetical protein
MFETKFSSLNQNFNTKFQSDGESFSTEFGSFVDNGQNFPCYKGEYMVTPNREKQELQTANSILKENIIVVAIPYSEVSNLAGGKTFNIAKE